MPPTTTGWKSIEPGGVRTARGRWEPVGSAEEFRRLASSRSRRRARRVWGCCLGGVGFSGESPRVVERLYGECWYGVSGRQSGGGVYPAWRQVQWGAQ